MTWEILKYRKCRLSAYMSGTKISGTLRIIQFAFSLHARLNYHNFNILALKIPIVFCFFWRNSMAKQTIFICHFQMQADTRPQSINILTNSK